MSGYLSDPIGMYLRDVNTLYEKRSKTSILELLGVVRMGTFPRDPLVIEKADFLRVNRKGKRHIKIEAPRAYLADLKDLLDGSCNGLLEECFNSRRELTIAFNGGEIDLVVTNCKSSDKRNLYLRVRSSEAINARERIVYSSLPFVIFKAKKYDCLERLDELVGAGNIGLLESIDRFRLDEGVSFFTSAAYDINAHILDHIQTHSKEFRLNQAANEKMNFIGNVEKEMTEKLGIIPTNEELYIEIKRLEKQGGRLGGYRVITRTNVGVFRTISAAENISLSRAEGEKEYEIPGQEKDPVDKLIEDDVAMELLEKLGSRKIAILAKRFGLRGFDEMSCREIADAESLTKERIRQLVKEGLREIMQMTV